MKIAVIGASGRMGQAMCAGVRAEADMELVAALDVDEEISADTLCGADVAIEFTQPDASLNNVLALIEASVRPVVGTTGWTEEAYGKVREALAAQPGLGAVIAPNFSLSAILAMRFAEQAAPYFTSAEVIETHHPGKLDAPSGTAIATAQKIAKARAGLGEMPDATTSDIGSRGAKVDGVPVHAMRLAGVTAREEIHFGNDGDQLIIRTDCTDRAAFFSGVALAAREVMSREGLIIGLDQLL